MAQRVIGTESFLRDQRKLLPMRLHILIVCLLVTFSGNLNAQDNAAEGPITMEELYRRNVVGQLGIILGTSTEIDAEIVSGRSLKVKAFDDVYLLKVTHVSGKKVSQSPLMQFSVFGPVASQLASQTTELYELKYGTKKESLNAEQIEELERGYLGKKVKLTVYETGGFGGVPNRLPQEVPVPAGVGFHFSTSLIVLEEVVASSPNEKPAK